MKWRFNLIRLLFGFFALLLWLRLAYWQVLASPELKIQAQLQRIRSLPLSSQRGEILFSDGFPMVTNQEKYTLAVNPQTFIADPVKMLELQKILPASDSANLLNNLNKKNLSWVILARQIDETLRAKIQELNLKGISFESEAVRMYPEASISAHLSGFVGQNSDGLVTGYFGLEGFYDRSLSGKPGKLIQEVDALNRPITIGGQNRIPPQDGKELKTSINRAIQYIVWQKLKDGIEKYGANSGTVTIMDPVSGQILAMVSFPSYDPRDFSSYDPGLYRNPIVADAFEPGSIFKTVVMAAALDAKVVEPDTKCDICASPVNVADYTIRTWNDKYYDSSTMTEVIQHSDNVGMVFVGRKLGQDKFLNYISKFGFGKYTGIDLQDEGPALLRKNRDWQAIDLATATFGQGIAVTPIQMLQAVSAIANLGKMTSPRIAISKERPKYIQVISPLAAAQITKMMVNSVDKGEAKWAKPKGFAIAGKTGTAQIPVAGHYDVEKTIASFVGFAPAGDPKFAMLVTLREPKTSQWGSETAAPLWFDISKEIFRLLKISPETAVN